MCLPVSPVFPKGQNHFTQNAVRLCTCSEPGQAHRPPSGTSCTSQTPRSLRSHQARHGQATQHTGDGSPCALPWSVGEVASGSQQSNEPALDTSQGGLLLPQCPPAPLCPAQLWSQSIPSELPLSQNISLAPKDAAFLSSFASIRFFHLYLASCSQVTHAASAYMHAYMHTHTSAWCGGLLAHNSQGPLLSRGSAHLLLLTSTLNTHTLNEVYHFS